MLRIGTRGSDLALIQTETVVNTLNSYGVETEVVEVETLGDRRKDWKDPEDMEGDGVFTRELDAALIEGEIDAAVHSMKDVPTDLPDGIKVAATPERVSPKDAVCGATLNELPDGAEIGTGSPRRQAMVKQFNPELEPVAIRGNVETRLEKVGDEVDAVVLAVAGLKRLDLLSEADMYLSHRIYPTAPGQGAIAVTTRTDGDVPRTVNNLLNDEATRQTVRAERALLNELGIGCVEPLGAYGEIEGNDLVLKAVDYENDSVVEVTGLRSNADEVGREAARWLKHDR